MCGGQVGDLDRRAARLALAGPVVEAYQGVLVGDVELVADQREAIRRVQIVGEYRRALS